jgi:hypothetical protein
MWGWYWLTWLEQCLGCCVGAHLRGQYEESRWQDQICVDTGRPGFAQATFSILRSFPFTGLQEAYRKGAPPSPLSFPSPSPLLPLLPPPSSTPPTLPPTRKVGADEPKRRVLVIWGDRVGRIY